MQKPASEYDPVSLPFCIYFALVQWALIYCELCYCELQQFSIVGSFLRKSYMLLPRWRSRNSCKSFSCPGSEVSLLQLRSMPIRAVHFARPAGTSCRAFLARFRICRLVITPDSCGNASMALLLRSSSLKLACKHTEGTAVNLQSEEGIRSSAWGFASRHGG